MSQVRSQFKLVTLIPDLDVTNAFQSRLNSKDRVRLKGFQIKGSTLSLNTQRVELKTPVPRKYGTNETVWHAER